TICIFSGEASIRVKIGISEAGIIILRHIHPQSISKFEFVVDLPFILYISSNLPNSKIVPRKLTRCCMLLSIGYIHIESIRAAYIRAAFRHTVFKSLNVSIEENSRAITYQVKGIAEFK